MTNERAQAVTQELTKVKNMNDLRNAVRAYWRAVGETKMQLSVMEAERLADIETALDRVDRAIDAAVVQIHVCIDTTEGVDK